MREQNHGAKIPSKAKYVKIYLRQYIYIYSRMYRSIKLRHLSPDPKYHL